MILFIILLITIFIIPNIIYDKIHAMKYMFRCLGCRCYLNSLEKLQCTKCNCIHILSNNKEIKQVVFFIKNGLLLYNKDLTLIAFNKLDVVQTKLISLNFILMNIGIIDKHTVIVKTLNNKLRVMPYLYFDKIIYNSSKDHLMINQDQAHQIYDINQKFCCLS